MILVIAFQASASEIQQMPYQYSYKGVAKNSTSSKVFAICEDCPPVSKLKRAVNIQLSIRMSGNSINQGGVAPDSIMKKNNIQIGGET